MQIKIWAYDGISDFIWETNRRSEGREEREKMSRFLSDITVTV